MKPRLTLDPAKPHDWLDEAKDRVDSAIGALTWLTGYNLQSPDGHIEVANGPIRIKWTTTEYGDEYPETLGRDLGVDVLTIVVRVNSYEDGQRRVHVRAYGASTEPIGEDSTITTTKGAP